MAIETITNNSTTNGVNLKDILQKYCLECFDKNGKLNLDKLSKELLDNEIDFYNESYGLDWLGKSYARVLAQDEIKTLIKEDKEFNKLSNSENILIKGDNLEVLKHLSYNYYEKIKMIYIDPPYNTGNDGFTYNDDRKFSVEELMSLASINEEKAKRILKFVNSNSNSHSAWLTFMYPRLYIAKKLLKENGVIFVSIDENEIAQLKLLMDEIFGEDNFITNLKIAVRYENKSLNEKKDFQEIQEYVLLYAKDANQVEFNKPTQTYSLDKFQFDIKHSKTPTKTITKNGRKIDIWEKEDFSIEKKEGSIDYFKETWITGSIYSNTGHGTMYKKMIENRIKEDGYNCLYRIYGIGDDGLGYRYYTNPKEKKYNKGKMYTKIPLDKREKIEKGEFVLKENPIVSYMDYSADFGNIRHEGGISFNAGKKPVKMLKQFINYIKNMENEIVLDFFAGSGTSGDAVMQLNEEDNGNRKFILVQLPEEIDPKKNKTSYDFVKEELGVAKPTIFDITKERLIRASKNKIDFKIFETIPIWDGYDFDIEFFNPEDDLSILNKKSLYDEDIETLLTTWKCYDGIALTTNIEEIFFDDYKGFYVDKKLYLMYSGFNLDHLKIIFEKIDKDKTFNPLSIIVFGYNFDSASLKGLSDNLKLFNNKKNLKIDFITRY